ncbi:hypothetical protein [Endothiovibrio diazotrophicus]
MFEIDGEHIQKLTDADLRILVARLCEAELRLRGYSSAAVTAGGHQDAADGGIDVRVALPDTQTIFGYIPRPFTGFQIKVPDMPPSAISKEMCPGGTVRPAIGELAACEGAYVIVSATGSTTDDALRRRRDAMRDAVTTLDQPTFLTIDFYDRTRLASWVREHPGIVAWVRERVGDPIHGWRPYDSWAAAAEPADAEYLIDEHGRVVDGWNPSAGAVPVTEGLRRIRETLAAERGVVRLIGLSGTGKTRFVQALFDERVGEESLGPALAVYTDLADDPNPSPRHLIPRLIVDGRRAVLVVDNCPPETHTALAKACAVPGSRVSLITVEYDVADDAPEQTEVFRLDSSSSEVIERILESHTPHIGPVDRRRIAEFSGGNARIALALASTVARGDSVTDFSDRDLLTRLFQQRNAPDAQLQRAAEILALVYSFDGETLDGEGAELPQLAVLAGLDVDQLYGSVVELRQRELIQARSKWRAVLPHALANRLARAALERLPPERVANLFTHQAGERLRRSFSRRLGYLHDSESARKIAARWLAEDGLFGDVSNLNELGLAMVENLAPAVPDLVLQAMERTANGPDARTLICAFDFRTTTWARLLRSFAYDEPLFHRATSLLSRMAADEKPNNNVDSPRSHLVGLFHLYLSGTHAPIGMRIESIRKWIASGEEAIRRLGFEALANLLKGDHFDSWHEFAFGARTRDFGWQPRTRSDIEGWYRAAIDFVSELLKEGGALQHPTRAVVARAFGEVWMATDGFAPLERLMECLGGGGKWPDGWRAVRKALRFDKERMSPDAFQRLQKLERKLAPEGLIDQIRAYVLPTRWGDLDIADGEVVESEDDVMAPYERVERVARELGASAANSEEVLDTVLPEVLSCEPGLGYSFGRGLGGEIADIESLWRSMVRLLRDVPSECRNTVVTGGYLAEVYERDRILADRLLDTAVDDPTLQPLFPSLQKSVPIGESGACRLLRLLAMSSVSAEAYGALTYGGVVQSIPPKLFFRLAYGLSRMPSGYRVALEMIWMRLHSEKKQDGEVPIEIVRCGRELLCEASFGELSDLDDFHVAQVISPCFEGDAAMGDARRFWERLISSEGRYRLFGSRHTEVVAALLRVQPMVSLDVLLGDGLTEEERRAGFLVSRGRKSMFQVLTVDQLAAWADLDPFVRYPRVAELSSFVDSDEKSIWIENILNLVERAPDKGCFLKALRLDFHPRIWWGSLADILQRRRKLPQQLLSHHDPEVVRWAHEQDRILSEWAERERESERVRSRQRDERFE